MNEELIKIFSEDSAKEFIETIKLEVGIEYNEKLNLIFQKYIYDKLNDIECELIEIKERQ